MNMHAASGLCTHGVSNIGGVTAGPARRNSSNAGGVIAGQVRHNSSINNDQECSVRLIVRSWDCSQFQTCSKHAIVLMQIIST